MRIQSLSSNIFTSIQLPQNLIQDILIKLEEIHEAGNKVQVVWFYEEEDEDMLDLGEEFSENVDIPFEIISF